jgi:hypothetical protein
MLGKFGFLGIVGFGGHESSSWDGLLAERTPGFREVHGETRQTFRKSMQDSDHDVNGLI